MPPANEAIFTQRHRDTEKSKDSQRNARDGRNGQSDCPSPIATVAVMALRDSEFCG